MPVLQRAQQVSVLIGDEGAGGLSEEPASLLHAMAAANVPVSVQRFSIGRRGIGDALSQEAQARGGDLLVMGAYTHSRLREAVLGGATREILADAALPVLLAH
jgi:nucleotide-binding universal stress UspA family protein